MIIFIITALKAWGLYFVKIFVIHVSYEVYVLIKICINVRVARDLGKIIPCYSRVLISTPLTSVQLLVLNRGNIPGSYLISRLLQLRLEPPCKILIFIYLLLIIWILLDICSSLIFTCILQTYFKSLLKKQCLEEFNVLRFIPLNTIDSIYLVSPMDIHYIFNIERPNLIAIVMHFLIIVTWLIVWLWKNIWRSIWLHVHHIVMLLDLLGNSHPILILLHRVLCYMLLLISYFWIGDSRSLRLCI